MNRLFLDTAYAVALAIEHDQYHSRAVDLAVQIAQQSSSIVTTLPILLEIGNYLTRLRYRSIAISYLKSLEEDPAVEIVPLTHDLFQRGISLYRDRSDKEWSLTDCISFVVMEEMDILHALTADTHFKQAGFEILLS